MLNLVSRFQAIINLILLMITNILNVFTIAALTHNLLLKENSKNSQSTLTISVPLLQAISYQNISHECDSKFAGNHKYYLP
jgi:hypothetical protein